MQNGLQYPAARRIPKDNLPQRRPIGAHPSQGQKAQNDPRSPEKRPGPESLTHGSLGRRRALERPFR